MVRVLRLCKTSEAFVERSMTEYRACPVPGCKHHKLVRHWDLNYEIVSCPEHGFQYPLPPTCVPPELEERFKAFVRSKPQPHARGNVFTPSAWSRFAQEFMEGREPRGVDRWGDPVFDDEGDWF